MIEILRMLNNISQGMPRQSSTYYVRSLDRYDTIPPFAAKDFPSPLTMKEWIWVAFSSTTDQPLALIAACPMHGVAFLVRVNAISSAPRSVFVGLLRKLLADLLSRGYTQYAVCLSSERETEAKLIDILKKAGGRVIQEKLTFYTGPTDIQW
jgi:hypothetical protein